MKSIFLLVAALFMFSCGNEKIVQLPEIDHAEITEINDVSAAYLFYNESQPDSTELNRKNLISTTNWLINVDKRLSLKQVIPHIQLLQDKKQNAGHKNPNAKNYFTCHDTSRNNLGFVEFTDVVYKKTRVINLITESHIQNTFNIIIHYKSDEEIKINYYDEEPNLIISNGSTLIQDIDSLITKNKNKGTLILAFDKNASFQSYIKIKSLLLRKNLINVTLSNNEYVSD